MTEGTENKGNHMKKDIFTVREKKERMVIGLMSGTSADGIDAVLTRITGNGLKIKVEEIEFLFLPFPKEVQEKIIRIAGGKYGGTEELCKLANYLGQQYARACEMLCEKAGIHKNDVDLVGNHGQTVWHMPQAAEYMKEQVRGTLQIGEDAYIAQALRCPVVGDFRVRDMAAGGLGAPLVPYVEYLLYRKKDKTVALQNIGGIGNVTILPENCTLDQVTAFDTGPGNMLMDAFISKMTNGWHTYDKDGRTAAQGQINSRLLEFLMEDPYLRLAPPKNSGREYYGREYLDKICNFAAKHKISDKDCLRTITRFTAQSIAYGLEHFAPKVPEQLIIGGGGSHNPLILSDLAACLPECEILTNEDVGYCSDSKEAVAFAVLASEAVSGNCNNVPSVTGACMPVIMGKITQ